VYLEALEIQYNLVYQMLPVIQLNQCNLVYLEALEIQYNLVYQMLPVIQLNQ
jgi:hypothetical protein